MTGLRGGRVHWCPGVSTTLRNIVPAHGHSTSTHRNLIFTLHILSVVGTAGFLTQLCLILVGKTKRHYRKIPLSLTLSSILIIITHRANYSLENGI